MSERRIMERGKRFKMFHDIAQANATVKSVPCSGPLLQGEGAWTQDEAADLSLCNAILEIEWQMYQRRVARQ